jgi:hypothetical protein|tara:strand:+ start:285 stop:515 length:231 start_codon:yes stop_codon:yes gene_type:complete
MDKLGLYINNLMATVVDNEENLFVRSLAFEELERLKSDISEFLLRYVDKFDGVPEELKEKEDNQLTLEFGEKHENK